LKSVRRQQPGTCGERSRSPSQADSLTDALSSVIISSVIIPRFKMNDYSGGIERGVDGIISVLTTDASGWHQRVNVRSDNPSSGFNTLFFILLAVFILFISIVVDIGLIWDRSPGVSRRGTYGGSWGSSGSGGGGSSGAGGSGGGFSGGGGSSGGGGASGSW
jgi:uncharacterized protein